MVYYCSAVYISPRASEIGNLLKVDLSARCFAQYVLQQQLPAARALLFAKSFKDLEAVRTDKQSGSSNSTAGTTNLVSKGLTAQVLLLATEYGAVKESTSNQTVTVQGSLDGIPAAAIQQSVIGYCPAGGQSQDPFCLHQSLYSWLRRFSYGVSFNTSQPSQMVSGTAQSSTGSAPAQQNSSQQVTFTASGREISAITGRIVLFNHRDATSQKFQDNWAKQFTGDQGNALKTAANNLLLQLQSFLNLINLSPAANPDLTADYTAWYSAAYAKLIADNDELAFRRDLNASVQLLYALVIKYYPAVPQQAADFVRSSEAYDFNEQGFIESVANTPLLSLEYDDNRPQNQSSYSTVRLIYDQGFGRFSITGNGAVSVNTTLPVSTVPGVSRYRDAQLGIELKYSLSSGSKAGGLAGVFGAAAVSGTYYFQYQNSPSVLNVTPGSPLTGITLTGLLSSATQIFAQKGNISIGQLRLELGPSGSSVRFPISVTYSNRSELLTKPDFRGQIGISYDFDSLFTNSGQGTASSK